MDRAPCFCFADLERRSLLSTSSTGLLQLHDVIAFFGRGIVLDLSSTFFGSRVWVQDGRVMGHQQVSLQARRW